MVSDDSDTNDEANAAESGELVPDTPSPNQRPGPGDAYLGLAAFSAIQRQLAAIDFSALTAARRLIEQATTFKIPEIIAAQEAVAKNFANSVDFSHLAVTHKALVDAGATAKAIAAQQRWAESLAKSVDFSALDKALASTAALGALAKSNTAYIDSLREQSESLSRIARSFTFKVPTIDRPGLLEALDRWIPLNLHDVDDIDVVANVALDEGIPLSWIPRTEIVLELIAADGPEDRVKLLTERRGDILDDCESALTSVEHEWAVQCRSAIRAMRADLDGPAQSHASNIVDSIVLGLHGKKGRDLAKERAQQDYDNLPLGLAAENLTLRPLIRAFTSWWPDSGLIPPDYFARHATSHAVGYVGVFAPTSALIAVMLASSLTVQYSPADPRRSVDRSEPAP
jgi:hypothetical protein